MKELVALLADVYAGMVGTKLMLRKLPSKYEYPDIEKQIIALTGEANKLYDLVNEYYTREKKPTKLKEE